jgi:hypothetical protein
MLQDQEQSRVLVSQRDFVKQRWYVQLGYLRSKNSKIADFGFRTGLKKVE